MTCAAQVSDPVINVQRYDWKGQTVLYFTMDCCDMYNPVYDEA